jgi:hypothetical protein
MVSVIVKYVLLKCFFCANCTPFDLLYILVSWCKIMFICVHKFSWIRHVLMNPTRSHESDTFSWIRHVLMNPTSSHESDKFSWIRHVPMHPTRSSHICNQQRIYLHLETATNLTVSIEMFSTHNPLCFISKFYDRFCFCLLYLSIHMSGIFEHKSSVQKQYDSKLPQSTAV